VLKNNINAMNKNKMQFIAVFLMNIFNWKKLLITLDYIY